jgi:DNA-binding NarL/FixJ family response regulator
MQLSAAFTSVYAGKSRVFVCKADAARNTPATVRPDVIVMDLSIPVMNGIQAAHVLKELMPTVPLIVFSEYIDVFSESEARSAGVSPLVSKSAHVSVLVEKARRFCGSIAA